MLVPREFRVSAVTASRLIVTIMLLLAFPAARASGDDKRPAESDIPKLIDQLVSATDLDLLEIWAQDGSFNTCFMPSDVIPDRGRFELYGPPIQGSEIVREIVSRGAPAIPHLIAHLDDSRPARMRLSMRGTFQGGTSFGEASWIDRNARTDAQFPAAKPLAKNSTALPEFHYVTVGDLCFVALGQIVNRRYDVVRRAKFGHVYSPTAMPELLALVKPIWKGMTPDRHRAILVSDVRRPDDPERRIGALMRLSYYYPDAFESIALSSLAAPTYDSFLVRDFVHETLYQARDTKLAQAAFEAFVKKHGEAYREGVMEYLFEDLLAPEYGETIRGKSEHGGKPRELLIQVGLLKPGTKSTDRPVPKVISVQERIRLIDRALVHDRSTKIDQIILRVLRGTTDDDFLALACLDRLVGRAYDAEIEAYCRRRLATLEKNGDAAVSKELRQAGWTPKEASAALEKRLAALGRTRLHIAAQRGDAFWVCEDVRDRAMLNAVDKAGQTPLHLAAAKGYLDCVQLLVEAGASLDVKNKAGFTPVQLAIRADHLEVTRLLIGRGCGIPDVLVAAAAGRGDVIKDLARGNPKVVLMMTEDFKRTALHLAAWFDRSEAADALLGAGAKADAGCEYVSKTALHIAAAFGRDALVRVLLKYKPNLQAKIDDGFQPLHFAAMRGHVKVVDLLLAAGTNIDAVDNEGETALSVAARNGHLAVIDALLKGGAKLNGTPKTANPLSCAVSGNQVEAAKLLAAKADVNGTGSSPLHGAAEDGYLPMVKLLLEHGAKVDARGWNERTPLQAAADNGHLAIVELLLKHGARVDALDGADRTALGIAAEENRVDVAKSLLAAGADINPKVASGWTPLHAAAAQGHVEMVKLLLERGAERDARDIRGKTPLDFARDGKHRAVIRLLETK